MKILLVSSFLFCFVLAEKLTLGLGAYTQTQPYKGVVPLLTPSPVIFYDNALLYIRWTRGGIYFLGNKSQDLAWGFSLTAQPRPYGYTSADSKFLEGISTKRNSIEAGLAFTLQKEKLLVEVMLLSDPVYKNKAYVVQSEIGYSFALGALKLYPGVMLYYQSSQFNQYYYGVRADEAKNQRELYLPRGGFSYAVHTYITYPLTAKLSVFAHLKVHTL